jgi:transketolase C-terminal domain/subunit
MKNARIDHFEDARCYYLADEKVITFQVRKIQIACRQGVVWVTWPDGNERVLKQGQSMTVVSNGLICVQAFAASAIVVQKSNKKISRLCVPCRPAELPAR